MYHSEFGRRLRSQSSGASSPSSSSLFLDRLQSSPSKKEKALGHHANVSAPNISRQRPGKSSSTELDDDDLENPFLSESPKSTALSSDADGSYGSRPATPDGRDRVRKSKSGIFGDRFIPHRDGSDVQSAFQLTSNEPRTPNRHKRKMSAAEMDAQREEANETFTTLLSSELFGADSNAFAAVVGSQNTARSSSSSSTPHANRIARPSLATHSHPTTPTKRNIFHYSSKSPTSGRKSQSTVRGQSFSPGCSSASLFGGSSPSSRAYDALDSPNHTLYNSSAVSLDSQRVLLSPRKTHRSIPKVPYKVLDAPDLADDFYLNLVDWSSKNVLGVGLANCVYLWSAKTSNVTKLCEVDRDHDRITSVCWSGHGNYLAVGLQKGLVQIWDAEANRLVRTMHGHSARVGCLAWNEHVLSTGSRDRSIYHRDVRVREHSVRELRGHSQEICGLKWNTVTNQLASGGNDNNLLVWDGLNDSPLYRFNQHRAAVKAIAWSPHQNGLLASGAGTADMHIRFFNTMTGQLLSDIDTGSQICNLAWSPVNNEIISTHGYSGAKVQNQVQVWKYPDMSQVATLMGHTMRVLYLAMSPDGESVVSGAGDETLRFWDLNTPGKGILSLGRSGTQTGPRSLYSKLR